jgi:uncharacterized protein
VGCRKRASAFELLRVVAVRGRSEPDSADRFTLVPDPARRLPGRGAHLHPDPTCLALAERRRAFGRALRLPSVPDSGALVEFIDPDGKDRTTDMSTR